MHDVGFEYKGYFPAKLDILEVADPLAYNTLKGAVSRLRDETIDNPEALADFLTLFPPTEWPENIRPEIHPITSVYSEIA